MGFFGLLLGTVLFLTGVWHYSVLEAGLAFAPGPLMVALLSWPAGRLRAGWAPPARLAGTVSLRRGVRLVALAGRRSPAYAPSSSRGSSSRGSA